MKFLELYLRFARKAHQLCGTSARCPYQDLIDFLYLKPCYVRSHFRVCAHGKDVSMTRDLTLYLPFLEELDMPEAQNLEVLFCLNAILETIADVGLTAGFPQEATAKGSRENSLSLQKSLPFDQVAADNEVP